MPRVAISSGHGLYVSGAIGIIDEVAEARRIVDELKILLNDECVIFHDNTSTSQDENLNTIVDWHNEQDRDIDVSVHFNCAEPTDGERGVEVFYYSDIELAEKMSRAIAMAGGLINRGAKDGSDLFFLENTDEDAILIEVCFVDAAMDVEHYQENFHAIAIAIARVLWNGGEQSSLPPYPTIELLGKVSWFGGPQDTGVAPDEGLAFFDDYEDAPHLFLTQQPEGTTGLARRLDPEMYYIAVRWDYDLHPKEMLASGEYYALVKAIKTGKSELAYPSDWGPHGDTDRIADISPGLMALLGIETDDEVEIVFPVSSTLSPPSQNA